MTRSLCLALGLLLVTACVPRGDPALDGVLEDDFNRTELGSLWRTTGGPYQLVDGKLKVQGARNQPLWLRRTLPHDVRVEFEVRSMSQTGDIKVELFGDGTSKATSVSYTSTSYVILFGAWGNSMNVIARLDEHGDDRAVGPPFKVQPGHTYRMKVERKGSTITAWADDHQLATLTDPQPLYGPGHDHFAINNWQSELWFDNLRVTPL
jgi:hypothetical protein